MLYTGQGSGNSGLCNQDKLITDIFCLFGRIPAEIYFFRQLNPWLSPSVFVESVTSEIKERQLWGEHCVLAMFTFVKISHKCLVLLAEPPLNTLPTAQSVAHSVDIQVQRFDSVCVWRCHLRNSVMPRDHCISMMLCGHAGCFSTSFLSHPWLRSERWKQETPRWCLLNSRHSVSYGRLTPPSALENSSKARHSSRDRLRRLSWRRGASLPIIQKWTWGSEKCHASEDIPIIIIIMAPFFGKVTESMLLLRYSTAGFSPR